MKFQRARSTAQIEERKEQIREAAFELYQKGDLAAVTFTNIAKKTTFSRPTIYTYFKTREEILLDCLRCGMIICRKELERRFLGRPLMTRAEYCHSLTDWVLTHKFPLRLYSIHHTQLEPQSRYEMLVAFNRESFHTFAVFTPILNHHCPDNTAEDIAFYVASLLFFFTSVYPLADPSPIQLKAFEEAEPPFAVPPLEESIYRTLLALSSPLHFAADDKNIKNPPADSEK